jgi:hypothetical protein
MVTRVATGGREAAVEIPLDQIRMIALDPPDAPADSFRWTERAPRRSVGFTLDVTRRAVLIEKPTGRIRGGRWLGCVRLFGAQTVANGPGTNGVTIVLPTRRVPSAATRAIYPSQGSQTCHLTAQGAARICPASASSAVPPQVKRIQWLQRADH